jgi:polyhydroxyalkanoate synthesis regulator phasin
LTGLGLAVLTKEKVEELAHELAEKGKLTEKEGKELVDSLRTRSEEARKELEAKIRGTVEEAIKKLNLATKRDIEDLAARIEELRQG